MTIRRGNVVSHTGAHEWGVGKVVEVTDFKATILFSDGITRKIAASHYATLQPASRASSEPITDSSQIKKARATPKSRKKKIQPEA